jgi:hypothetical protein
MHADAPVVFNETVFTKAIHEEADTGPGGPNHFRQGFLRNPWYQRFRFTGLTELRH